MEYKTLTIAVRNCTLKEVTDVLESVATSEILKQAKGININICDYTEEFAYTSRFLKENNLEDENPFLNNFDLNPFSLHIDFDVMPNFKYVDILEPIVFILGKHVSSLLKTECIILFENMQLPAGLFKEGMLIETFENYNSEFFKNRSWKPNQI